MSTIRCLIVDNYDSFTFNIRERLGVFGIDAVVVRNDEVTMQDIADFCPTHIILGPGPGTPEHPEDVGVSFDAITYAEEHRIPLLGVCLGHQVLAKHFGGRIVQAPRIVHGSLSRLARVIHSLPFPDLFDGYIEELYVMRYHSLAAETVSFPSCLIATVTTQKEDEMDSEGNPTIMGLQHRTLPIYGIQFHPESRFTPCGDHLLQSFIQLPSPNASQRTGKQLRSTTDSKRPQYTPPKEIIAMTKKILAERQQYSEHTLKLSLTPSEVYDVLSHSCDACYLFESLPPLGEQVFVSGDHRFTYIGLSPRCRLQARNEKCFLDGVKITLEKDVTPFSVLSYMVDVLGVKEDTKNTSIMFTGGMVGYVSYEAAQYRESQAFQGRTPEGEWTFDLRYYEDVVLFDRLEQRWTYTTRGHNRLQEILSIFQKYVASKMPRVCEKNDETSRAEFEGMVRDVIAKEIVAGNAQQVVLSRKKLYSIDGQLSHVYSNYRAIAPSANMHAMKYGDIETVGSFPEVMVQVQGDNIRTIQLAGTRRRSGDGSKDQEIFTALRADPKDTAEHRMLVDLARNDVARSSVLGSVRIPDSALMYRLDGGPVMHIASTIDGTCDPQVSPTMVFLNIAPMGTVSGSPKVSAMQIIYREEQGRTRGIYAGSIGFFDVRGITEFVVGLRNIVRRGSTLTIQAGAGIVMGSDPASEYDETVAKMSAPLGAITPFLLK